MSLHLLPGRNLLIAIGVATAIALLLCILNMLGVARWFSALTLLMLITLCMIDWHYTKHAWRVAALSFSRRLPAAFALGVKCNISISLMVSGERSWSAQFVDHSDASLKVTDNMPVNLILQPDKQVEFSYAVIPTQRGEVAFAPAALRLESGWKLLELQCRIGVKESRRVYPDFAQVAKYAWLAGDRRLSEIGIKTFTRRGEGTDFKQLSEYRVGDSLRHIDWKATLRFDKPIVREFQDERDQCVLMLIDCGRRLRADERTLSGDAIGSSHFDQVLNAAMLLSYVALKQGDAVGALTFGTPVGQQRWFAPRKGISMLNALMNELYAVQPTLTHSDYVMAAKDLLRRQTKRAMVIIVSNFRDEDADELSQAIRLLRTRHLVLTASLRERVIGEMAAQPMDNGDALIEIASAHLYEQARRDAFNKLSANNALIADAEPERLGIELVNRYQAAKRAGRI